MLTVVLNFDQYLTFFEFKQISAICFQFNQLLSLNISEHDPDYWAKDEELRLALVAAGEEFDYIVHNARVLLVHKVKSS